jgi:4-amino-4-deoxy-L-arabinose transferase-like glycosyltransferase
MLETILTVLCGFQTLRLLAVLLCGLLAMVVFPGYGAIIAQKHGKRLFWVGVAFGLLAVGLTIAMHLLTHPRGLTGTYYENPAWAGDPVNSLRYFRTRGQRVDRFIDFNPNDFINRYPFSGQPFSARWEGAVVAPAEEARLAVESNFGTWLYVDDALVAGEHQRDLGTPEARTYLREGWSHDERWPAATPFDFVWGVGRRSEVYVGVDEIAEYKLAVRCQPFTYEGSPPQTLTAWVNDTAVGTVTLTEGWQISTFSVPVEVIRQVAPGFFRVRFTYQYAARPSDVLPQSQDGRRLAVAFDWVVLQKAAGRPRSPADCQPPAIRSGLHRITLKALHNSGDAPFIRLVWRRASQSESGVIPEGYLFPQAVSPETIEAVWRAERALLGAAVLLTGVGVVLLLGLLLCSAPRWNVRAWLTPDALLAGAVGLLAFGLLLGFWLERLHNDPTFHVLPIGTDHLNFVFFARGFLRGYWPWYGRVAFSYNPMVYFFLILTQMVVGESLLISRLLVALLSAASVMLVYLIARQAFTRPVALVAALLCALNGVYLCYGSSLLVAPQAVFWNVLMLWFVQRAYGQWTLRNALIVGVLFGILGFARPTFFLFLPFLFLAVVVEGRQPLFRKGLYCATVCLVLLLVICPVTIYNYFSNYHHPLVLLTSSGGFNLWMGNNPEATGRFGFNRNLANQVRQQINAGESSYVKEVWRFLINQPAAYLHLQWKKWLLFWGGFEQGNLMSYYFYRTHFSRLLKLPFVNFVLIGPLSLVGLVLAGRAWKRLYLLYAFVVVQTAVNVLFTTSARFRLPAVPMLAMFAAYTLVGLFQRLRRRQWLPAGLIGLAFVILYVGLNYPPAAALHEQRYQRPLPVTRLLRYWDLYHFEPE